MNTITKPFDGTGQTVNSIVSLIITHYNNDNQAYHGGHARREDYYCGITNDIPSNLSRHGIEGYVFCIECASYAVSSKAEEMLDVEGFDIGDPPNRAGNGGVEDSVIVYMAFKDNNFRP